MIMVDPNVEGTIRKSDDTKLLTMLSKPDDYLPEALAIALDELENRGGLEAVKASVQAEAEAEIEAEEAKYPDIPVSEYRYPKMWIGIVLTIVAFLVLSIGFAFAGETDPDDIPWFAVGATLLLLIPTYVYWLVCIYKLHSLLRQHTKGKYPITPGQAVGYGFIPFYNLYWMFRWPNQIVDFVNESDPPKRMKKGWPGFWLLFSVFFWKASSALSYLIKFIVGIRLVKRVRMAIEKT